MEFSIYFSNLFANRKMASFVYCFFFFTHVNRNKSLKFFKLPTKIKHCRQWKFLAQKVIITFNLRIDWINKKDIDRMLQIILSIHMPMLFSKPLHIVMSVYWRKTPREIYVKIYSHEYYMKYTWKENKHEFQNFTWNTQEDSVL